MRVGVVGCGIGGMASAAILAQDGAEVTVFERFSAPAPVGAGLLLQPSGLSTLARMDLIDHVISRGGPVFRVHGRTADGDTVLDLRYGEWRPEAFGLGIHRATLFDALLLGMERADVELVCSCEITAIDQPANPTLIAGDGRRFGPFDLVILADGQSSALRTRLFPEAKAALYPWGAVWTTRPDPEGRWRGGLAQTYRAGREMMGVLPIGEAPGTTGGRDNVAVFWSLRNEQITDWRKAGLNAWRDKARALWPEAADLLDGVAHLEEMTHAVYRNVRARRWVHERVVMLGDAAHGTSPQLGQGANLALSDAAVLGDALDDCSSPDAALALWQEMRRPYVTWTQAMSALLTPAFQSDGWFAPGLRDLALGPLSRAPIAGKLMLNTLVGAARLPSLALPR
jgi:2-polyprenyl-6-methoxyphenol hydroxylase-like FAD-dependent oxidoreductase